MDDVANLLKETADEHHRAFASTDGIDPDWPQWYAARMRPRLHEIVSLPVVRASSIAWLSVEQMVEADRLAIHDFGISLLQMMEHAGSALSHLVNRLAPTGSITVLAGGGNNGAGGLCAARHLANSGRDVQVVMASQHPGEAARHHLATLSSMGIEPAEATSGDVVVDALVGYGLSGPLRGISADLARWSEGRTVLSLDIPSGHGHPNAVVPAATLTLALPKVVLRDVAPLYLADLGLPEALWARMGLESGHPFADGRVVRIEQ